MEKENKLYFAGRDITSKMFNRLDLTVEHHTLLCNYIEGANGIIRTYIVGSNMTYTLAYEQLRDYTAHFVEMLNMLGDFVYDCSDLDDLQYAVRKVVRKEYICDRLDVAQRQRALHMFGFDNQ